MSRTASNANVVVNEATAARDYWASNHSQSARLPAREEQPHRWLVAEHIVSITPRPVSLLEFGCSSARNLGILARDYGITDCVGIDANPTTIAAARDAYPDMYFTQGDERALASFNDDAFDVVLSVSVLDHIPAPQWRVVYDELVRVARVAVVLLEPLSKRRHFPMLAPETVEMLDFAPSLASCYADCDVKELGIESPPYSYVHDYLGHDAQLRIVRPLPVTGLAQWEQFGRLYHLFERRK